MSRCLECSLAIDDDWPDKKCIAIALGIEDCHITEAAERLAKLLVERGISDEDAGLVERAIAGKGRLRLISDVVPFDTCEKCQQIWQDQGGE